MRRLGIGILGWLCGIALGIALLALNPVALTQPLPTRIAGSNDVLRWTPAVSRGFALTPRSLIGMNDAGSRAGFVDPGIAYARAEIAALSGPGPGAVPLLAVRLSALSRDNSLLRAQLGVVTHTHIVWPQQGSLFLTGSENLWRPLRDGLWSALRGQGFNPAGGPYPLPPMPGSHAVPVVIGATGSYTAARGTYLETLTPMSEFAGDLAVLREIALDTE